MRVHRRKSHWTGKWVWEVKQGNVVVSPHFHSKQEAQEWMDYRK